MWWSVVSLGVTVTVLDETYCVLNWGDSGGPYCRRFCRHMGRPCVSE